MSILLASLTIWSCGGRSSDAPDVPTSETPAAPSPEADVVARVNGVALYTTDAELLLRQHDRSARDPTTAGGIPQSVIDTLVRDELRAQEAMARGLDRDPKYQSQLSEKEAVFAAWRREALGNLLIAERTATDAAITDDEARAYFRTHRAELATETHVLQILMRDRAAIDSVEASLISGRSFEDVAAEHFAVPATSTKKPWDLGYLRWAQLPEPWKPILGAVPVGGTSGVIESGGRFWILHVVDRRTDPSLDFDRARPDVMHALEVERESRAVSTVDDELREKAQVEGAP
jgi:parvulin-like peptidyl-prolyl isomerase